MKIKNSELLVVCATLEKCYNAKETHIEKMAVADIAKRFYEKQNDYVNQATEIINRNGNDGQLSTSDPEYVNLLETEIEIEGLTEEELDFINPSLGDMIVFSGASDINEN